MISASFEGQQILEIVLLTGKRFLHKVSPQRNKTSKWCVLALILFALVADVEETWSLLRELSTENKPSNEHNPRVIAKQIVSSSKSACQPSVTSYI